MIAAKKKKSKPRAQTKRETKAPRGGNVIDIMEALRKSLEKEGKA
jgi:DNA end-binding protein Ku